MNLNFGLFNSSFLINASKLSSSLYFLKVILGYCGYFYSLKLSFKLFHKLSSYFFTINNKYKKEDFHFPYQINFVQERNINYVLINWNALKQSAQFCSDFIKQGFKIILLVKREEKFETIYLREQLKLKKDEVIIKSYKENINDFNRVVKNKLKNFYSGSNHISVYVNHINTNTNLKDYLTLMKNCLDKMARSRGKSLVIGLADKDSECNIAYNFAKKLHNQMKIEYNSKIEIIFLKNHTENSVLKQINKVRVAKMNLANKNYHLFQSPIQYYIYNIKKYLNC